MRLRPVCALTVRSRTHRRRLLKAEKLERRMLLTAVTEVSPLAGSHDASATAEIRATFDQDINPATVSAQTFVVRSIQRGSFDGATVAANGATVRVDPPTAFFPGELVHVTATSGIHSTSGDPVVPRSWHFRSAVASGSAIFEDSGQRLGDHSSRGVSIGDLDGDGDLDVFFANAGGQGNRVWLNDGSGTLVDSAQSLGDHNSAEVALGDLDSDGDLDAFIANRNGHVDRLYLNDGNGAFTDSGQTFGDHDSRDVQLGDLDSDGDLDAFVATAIQGHRVWLNDGNGTLTSSGQTIGNHYTYGGFALGDLDTDGDLDAFTVNAGQPARIWLNDGAGVFSDSGQLIGDFTSNGDRPQLGDLDGDGDLDAFVANYAQGNRVWLNGGDGVFFDSGQSLGNHGTDGLSIGDLDGDGDLDAITANTVAGQTAPNHIWLNDGSGEFTDSGQLLANNHSRDVALGDLDGDGDLDAVFANGLYGDRSNFVWVNRNLSPSVSLEAEATSIEEAGGATTVTARLSAAHTAPVTIGLSASGTATASEDYTLSATEIVIPAGVTSGSVTVSAVQDAVDEPDETILLDIVSVSNGNEAGTQQVEITILDDDEPIPMPEVSLAVDLGSIPEAGGVATFTATLSEVTTVPVIVDLAVFGTASPSDYSVSATQMVIAPGSLSGSITVTATQDTDDEPDETVIVEIAAVVGGSEVGDQSATVSILDDDEPLLGVSSLTWTASGFAVDFSAALDDSAINLYETQDGGQGAADVTLVGAASGPVAGSVLIDPSGGRVEFIKTGSPLVEDTYTVTLRSEVDAFRDLNGQLLDGNDDGAPGDDFVESFVVDARDDAAITIGIPDFVRGPGQPVNLPADEAVGIPVTISNGANVRAVDLRISYDPSLLEITDAAVGPRMPNGSSVVVNTSTSGLLVIVFFSSTALPAGSETLINLRAVVPSNARYGEQQVLDLHAVTISDGNDNEFPVIADDAYHLTSYFADTSGNERINAADAAQLARLAALIDTGFSSSLNSDPAIVGDISGNGRVNAADASLVAQFAALIAVPEIPPVPATPAAAKLDDHQRTSLAGTLVAVDELPHSRVADSGAYQPSRSNAVPGSLWTVGDARSAAVDVFMAELVESRAISTDEDPPMSLRDVIKELGLILRTEASPQP